MIAIGIDCGLTGAIAAINATTHAVAIADMPTREVAGGGLVQRRIDGRALANLLRTMAPESAILTCELVHAIAGKESGQGGMQQMGSMMRSFGAIEAIVDALRLTATWPRPQAWKKFYGLGKDKGEALDMARTLYPEAQAYLARAKDHNRAEALLIAHFGLRSHAG
jgi:hypothetical protein